MNMTQEELAKKIGYSKKTVSKWELGNCIPSIHTLVLLAQFLGTDVNTLVGYTCEPMYFLGIDGGATKTEFVLCDANGKTVSTYKLSSCNPVDIGIEYSKAILREGIKAVCKDIPIGTVSVFAGISGGITGTNQKEINNFLSSFGFSAFNNGSDIENAISVTLGKENGIVAIMGTGSVLFAIDGKERRRIGGYGYLFDNGGNGYDIAACGNYPLLIGGGCGVPPLYLLAKKLHGEGKLVSVILGFNKKSEVFFEEEFRALGADVTVTTADGSYGIKGFVTTAMKNIKYDYFYTCGPGPMFRAVYDASGSITGQFSFEERMGCGFGACMGCTCKTKYGNKRICKDGPVLVKEEIIW
jgi:dihydroorotate dehydrogenase electron transfer subunit